MSEAKVRLKSKIKILKFPAKKSKIFIFDGQLRFSFLVFSSDIKPPPSRNDAGRYSWNHEGELVQFRLFLSVARRVDHLLVLVWDEILIKIIKIYFQI